MHRSLPESKLLGVEVVMGNNYPLLVCRRLFLPATSNLLGRTLLNSPQQALIPKAKWPTLSYMRTKRSIKSIQKNRGFTICYPINRVASQAIETSVFSKLKDVMKKVRSYGQKPF